MIEQTGHPVTPCYPGRWQQTTASASESNKTITDPEASRLCHPASRTICHASASIRACHARFAWTGWRKRQLHFRPARGCISASHSGCSFRFGIRPPHRFPDAWPHASVSLAGQRLIPRIALRLPAWSRSPSCRADHFGSPWLKPDHRYRSTWRRAGRDNQLLQFAAGESGRMYRPLVSFLLLHIPRTGNETGHVQVT